MGGVHACMCECFFACMLDSYTKKKKKKKRDILFFLMGGCFCREVPQEMKQYFCCERDAA